MSDDDILDILIDGPNALMQHMVMFSPLTAAKPLMTAGKKFLPMRPEIALDYRLVNLPEVGVSTLTSESWAFAAQLAGDGIKERLNEVDGPVRATLSTRHVTYTARNGERAGQLLSYSHPVLTILGPLATADAVPGSAREHV